MPETPKTSSMSARGSRRLCLVVIADTGISTHPVPADGALVLGRSTSADIHVDAAAVSREHAVLHLGADMTLEDLGSSNGTTVRGVVLEPGASSPVALGDSFTLGTATVTLHRERVDSRPRRVWSHDYFEARLDEECDRAVRTGQPFAVARVYVDAAAGALEMPVAAAVRRGDLVAAYAPCELEILLVGATPEQSAHVVDDLRRSLADAGAQASVGVARFPDDGRSPEALMRAAQPGAVGRRRRRATAGVVWQSPAMRQLQHVVEKVARGTISVLLAGKTGVGKEVFAERIHELSPRRGQPLVRLNCAAFAPELLESELFGHEQGAFTGAHRAKPGLWETASGGTVFLDEIGDMPAPLQAKLLRVLEDRQVLRVGAVTPCRVDVRVVAATHRDLEVEVARGAFRKDLYYRLAGATIAIPPLRDRRAEIPALARAFVDKTAGELGQVQPPQLTAAAVARLVAHSWPGNIRELRNVIERAVLLCGGDAIDADHVAPNTLLGCTDAAAPHGLAEDVRGYERRRLIETLEQFDHNQTAAAAHLGIARRTLISKMDKYGIRRPRRVAVESGQ